MSLRKDQPSKGTLPTMAMQSPQPAVNLSEAPTAQWHRQPASPARPAAARPFFRRHWFLLLTGGFISIGLALLLSLVIGAYMLWQSDWILPGVQVLGLDLGQKPLDEATTTLSTYWQQQAITLDSGDQTWSVPPETLGITFDVEATIQRAYQQGRSYDSLVAIFNNGGRIQISPAWEFNEAVAAENLQTFAPQLEIAPIDAGVQVVNGQVKVTPAVAGRRLDSNATLNGLVQNPGQTFSTGRLPLVTVPVQPTITDVSAIAAQAGQLLSTVINIRAFDPVTGETLTWALTPDLWNSWASLQIIAPETAQFNWDIDSEKAKAFLVSHLQTTGSTTYLDWEGATTALTNAIASQEPEVRLRIYHHPSQHIVQSGDTFSSIGRDHGIPYPWIQHANPGISDQLSVGQVLTIPSPDDLLPYPVVENKRIRISISQQRMWAYENGNLKWEWAASTGIDSSPTSPGVFQIQTHEDNAYAASWDLWMPYFMGIYQPVPTSDFMNGFHGFPTRDGVNLLWTGNLGQQVTYGCILLSNTNASQLYSWAEQGVVVEIQQ